MSATGYVKSYITSRFCLSIINISLKAKPCYTLFFIFKYLIDNKRTHTNPHATTTIKNMMSRFWWGQKMQERKVHWLSWSKLYMPKLMGGIGFWELHSFNLAMLAKQGWRLMKNTHSLFYRVYKSKYFPNISFLDAPSPNLGSFAWKSIVVTRSVLDSDLRWRVGIGNKIRIWQDRWLPTPPSFKVVTPCSTMSSMATVDH